MSLSWSSGYSTDVAYILGYYRELAPSFLDYVCRINSVTGVDWSRSNRYCELGCGRGFGTTLLAAANPDMTFVGIDFNPTHIAEARAFAKDLRLPNLTFREMSFGEAAKSADPDLGEFDVVGMHGVYSWVTPSVREDIHEFVRRKLVPAGVFFVSYNTMPGWAPVGPIQHLLQEVAHRSAGDSLTLFGKGYELLQTLVEKSSAFVVQNPTLKERVLRMEKQDKRYLAHEFLNVGWQPLYITDTMAMLSEAKLAYVGSANICENRLELAIPKEMQSLVAAAPDLAMRELLKDYVVNKYFRRDVYAKGPLHVSGRKQREQLDTIAFARTDMGVEVPDTLGIPAGQATPKRDIMTATLDRLSEGAATAAELIEANKNTGASPTDIFMLLEILVHRGVVNPVRPDHASVDQVPSHRLNKSIMSLTSAGDTHRYLASPILGSAVSCEYADRLMAPLMLDHPKKDDKAIGKTVQERLKASGFNLQRGGAPIPEGDEVIETMVKDFRSLRLPHWLKLGLLPNAARQKDRIAAAR
jgi:SAM-dependent methyltransferase